MNAWNREKGRNFFLYVSFSTFILMNLENFSKRVFEKYKTPLKLVIMFNYGVYGTKIIPQRFKRCRMANH
jgi:hypothetical protein